MGVGQPGVEREAGDLKGKAQEEAPEGQTRQQKPPSRRQVVERLSSRCGYDIERARGEVGQQNRQEHSYGAYQGVDKELDRGITPVLAAPDADQQVHRHEADFPENVEQNVVQRDKHAQHAQLEQMEHGKVLFDARVDDAGAIVNAQR